ncbi:transforming growth factor, beta receptor associated protein 1 [Goodea atripinnis]|uniref:Transforming growth factor, beta receptor associated protein 1 n=1 Tax=Goodea atripinnis TaxID=208336 RepID=A0ABV0PK51_9TELE
MYLKPDVTRSLISFRYFALGLLYHFNGQDAAALQLWIRIVDGELQDCTRSDLYEYIVDFLCCSSNMKMVWKYADWALRKDPTTGVHIFTKRPVSKGRSEVNPDEVITYLGKHSQALLLYLEHLVLERKIQVKKELINCNQEMLENQSVT